MEFLLYHPSENIVLEGELTSNSTYYMIKEGDKLIPSNVGINSTTSYSNIPIDMRRATSSALLTVNAEISSQESYDIGYAIVNENKNAPAYNTSAGRLIYISGSVEAQDYTMLLEPGKIYYLHMGYRKNGNTHTGADKFTINSITLSGAQPLNSYTTDSKGQISLKLKPGVYTLDEISTLNNYALPSNPFTQITISKSSNTQEITLTNNKKRGTVIVHYYIQGTTNSVPAQSGGTVSDISKEGIIGTPYATQQSNNVSPYYDLVGTPANTSGEYIDGQIEVIYYYRKSRGMVNLIVNKDGTGWNESGVKMSLYQFGREKYSYEDATITGNVISWDMVDLGAYDIYASDNTINNVLVDSGQDIIVK